MGCPSDEDLACHAGGLEHADVATHVATCAACASVVAALRVIQPTHETVAIGAPGPADAASPIPGSLIDRYVVLRPLGRGGMGVVVLAYDPVLDRTVAVKLMRPELAAGELAARLEREARSLARLAHTNIVRVFDAGTWKARVFMAMEHIEGETVRAWLRSAPRTTAEILRVFIEAGRGLVATHDAGFVHRDVKPGNILLGRDGTARLADFGLVGGEAASDAPAEMVSSVLAVTPPTARDREPITRPDAAMGTPGYMAPEQRAGHRVGAAADQFGFCASVWQALFEVHAVPDQSATPEPHGKRHVPSWVREILARGLRAVPEARWPSMRALLDALEHDPVAARHRRLMRGGIVAAIVVLGGLSTFALTRDRSPADRRCKNLDTELAGVWNPTRSGQVERAFLATGRPQAAATAGRVAARLDAYTRTWVAARIETCEATHRRGVQSEAVLDLRMACLDRRLRDVEALVEVLGSGLDAAGIDRAVPAANQLAPVEVCADVASLQLVIPLPADPKSRAAIADVQGSLADALALEVTGQYRLGLEASQRAVASARDTSYAPVIAEALHRRASLEDRVGDARAAAASLDEALVAAGRARDDELASAIWSDLIYIVGGPLAQPNEALRMRAGAEAALARAGGEPRAEARLSIALAMTHYMRGDFAKARQVQEHAISLLERTVGREHADLGPPLSTLGNFLLALGAHDDALATHERALRIFEATLGSEHPSVAASLTNLGLVLQRQGRLDEALTRQERALAIHERTLGASHPVVAATLTNLGLVLDELGRHGEARARHERALAIRELAFGGDHPDVAVSLNNLGATAFAERRFAEAQQLHARALTIRERALGHAHADVATSVNNLADAEAGLGHHRAALAHYERALTIWRAALGAEHPHLAYALSGRASERLALGDAVRARADAERALEIRQANGASPRELAASRLLLARALWALGRERTRAIELARAASDGPAGPESTEAKAWLAARFSGR